MLKAFHLRARARPPVDTRTKQHRASGNDVINLHPSMRWECPLVERVLHRNENIDNRSVDCVFKSLTVLRLIPRDDPTNAFGKRQYWLGAAAPELAEVAQTFLDQDCHRVRKTPLVFGQTNRHNQESGHGPIAGKVHIK